MSEMAMRGAAFGAMIAAIVAVAADRDTLAAGLVIAWAIMHAAAHLRR